MSLLNITQPANCLLNSIYFTKNEFSSTTYLIKPRPDLTNYL